MRKLLLTATALLGQTLAKDFYGRIASHGTVGLGLEMYAPVTCAYACRATMGSWMLDCTSSSSSSTDSMDHSGMDMPMEKTKRDMMDMEPPTPLCYANNEPFLTSLAWCIYSYCPADTSIAELERYWEDNVPGRMEGQPKPKVSYQHALGMVGGEPTTVHNSSEMLKGTELVSGHMWHMNMGALEGIEVNIGLDNQYALAVLLSCSLAPILLSLLRFLPFPQGWVSKFYAHVIDPPFIGTNHAVPVFFGLGIMPTRGQALFIFYIWGINIILSAVGYQVTWPNLWFTSVSNEMVEWIANRTGMLSFANLSLAILYSSRNSVLLYLTSWSRNTFILIHRWIAVICILQACLHSALYLQFYNYDSAALKEESAYPYWYWGIIATLSLVFLIPGSLLPIRRKAYEFFLAWHFLWVLLALTGCFLHIYLRYHWQWGYELWVAIAFAIWAADWLLARPFRIVKNGFGNKAFVEVIDEDYIKVEIPGVEAQGQAHLYFPTLSWRIWENHPFSVIPVSGGAISSRPGSLPSEDLESGDGKETAKAVARHVLPTHHARRPGIAFFVRKRGGLTAKLAKLAGTHGNGITVLVESSYGNSSMSLLPSPDLRPSHQYPNLIILAGGVGITAVLPLIDRSLFASHGQVKLYWGVRKQTLVTAVEQIQGEHAQTIDGRSTWGKAEVSIKVGERFDFGDVLERELRGGGVVGGTTVVVCGPSGMSDEVRGVVSTFAQGGVSVRFCEERFSC